VDEESEQTIVVEFIQDGVVLDSRRYADMDEIPDEVEIGGRGIPPLALTPKAVWRGTACTAIETMPKSSITSTL
jgi:hypothetical protein